MQGNYKILELISQKSSISEVEPLLKELQIYLNLNDEIYHNILIAITEAVNNALIHGNKLDKNKVVQLLINIDNDELEFVVTDQGSGFNPEEVPDPRHPENIYKDNGRGVFLIKNLALKSFYESSDKGTIVKIYFKIK